MKFFYNFCLIDDDTDLRSDILSGVRKGYFNGFQKIRDRITINSDSDSVSYDYAIEQDKPMNWDVRSHDKTVLQDVALSDNGKYYICFYRDGALYKRILFSRLHTLLRVEYFDAATGLQMISLEPRKAAGGLCILYDSRVTPQPIVLYPMTAIADDRVRRKVEERFVNYTVAAATDEGIVWFLSADQERTLRTFIEYTEKSLTDEPEESFVGDDTPLLDKISAKDFNVKRNLATSVDITKAQEFSFVREEEPDAAAEDAQADVVAQAAAAAIQSALSADDAEPQTDDTPAEEPAAPKVACDELAADEGFKPDKMIMADGAMYRYYGELDAAGNRSGYGRTVTEDGRTAYEGCYLNDKRSGNGSYYYKDGCLCYTGDWVENARHGVGVGVSSHDGSIHVGRWALNKPEGNGVRLGADGDIRFVCKELSDGSTVLMNYMPDDTVVIAKYDEKGKKLGDKTLSLKDILKI